VDSGLVRRESGLGPEDLITNTVLGSTSHHRFLQPTAKRVHYSEDTSMQIENGSTVATPREKK
jgi:hypothetical protein